MSDQQQQKKPGKIVTDPELLAMAEAAEVLDDLPQGVAVRVVAWLADRYRGGPTAATGGPPPF